ncbi:MAG TPA: hypothetical protein V6C46_00025, partial [Coleofasciculaceae cyanobacterium]
MLANAWFPHSYFKLSFGSQDKIAQQLDALALVVKAPVVQFKDPDKTLLRQAIATVCIPCLCAAVTPGYHYSVG